MYNIYALKIKVFVSSVYVCAVTSLISLFLYYILYRFMLQVTGIVGRADVLACIFFLLSFLAYHG